MARSIPKLLILATLATPPCTSQQAGLAPQPVPSRVVPLKEFPRDHRFATISGDPKESGALYVIRIHSEMGYIIMPHTHPEDEHITVVKGSWALGMGDCFNPDALETIEVGTYGLVAYSSQVLGSWDVFQSREEILKAFGRNFELLCYERDAVGGQGGQDALVLRKPNVQKDLSM